MITKKTSSIYLYIYKYIKTQMFSDRIFRYSKIPSIWQSASEIVIQRKLILKGDVIFSLFRFSLNPWHFHFRRTARSARPVQNAWDALDPTDRMCCTPWEHSEIEKRKRLISVLRYFIINAVLIITISISTKKKRKWK